jgi:hypothetical protein
MNDPSEAELGQPGPFQLLSGLIRPKKFGLDPTLQAIALYLSSVLRFVTLKRVPLGALPTTAPSNDGVDLMFTPRRCK